MADVIAIWHKHNYYNDKGSESIVSASFNSVQQAEQHLRNYPNPDFKEFIAIGSGSIGDFVFFESNGNRNWVAIPLAAIPADYLEHIKARLLLRRQRQGKSRSFQNVLMAMVNKQETKAVIHVATIDTNEGMKPVIALREADGDLCEFWIDDDIVKPYEQD